ncbi:MAG: M1 family metallopeptidase [Gemmatimonadota bacterium]|nr:M1 family metallopeptidase [Gemmatimonadota bacterium]
MNRLLPVLVSLVAVSPGAMLPGALHAQATPSYTHADTLRGSIGASRAWWDVTFYDLRVRVNPADSSVSGHNAIVYRVLEPGDEMQIDLQTPLQVDSVMQAGRLLDWTRDGDAWFVLLMNAPRAGDLDTLTVYYSGKPRVATNPPWAGGLILAQDSLGRPWMATANQGLGASVWWPTKDTQADEPQDGQRIAITVPDPMVNVSNGRLRSVINNADGTTTWEWYVQEPINNYNVTLTAGPYVHFGDFYDGEDGVLTLDYWPLDYHVDAAREQFYQVRPMLDCFEHWFGPYPWYRDGFKLIETPHLGMEHQSGIAYGNRYENGYLGRDLSGTGLGLDWDFIIIHESAHEWWGNNLTSADLADMWVHESFANYAESIYTECMHGTAAGADYVVGVRRGIRNDRPIIPAFGVNAQGSGDMYSKGGNLLHTVRQLVSDDETWRMILRGLNETFRHSVVTGEQVVGYISQQAGTDLGPVFRQYLTTTDIPVLEFARDDDALRYRWAGVLPEFAMPVEVSMGGDGCTWLNPTSDWQILPVEAGDPAEIDVDRDYYVRIKTGEGEPRPAGARCQALP